MEKRVTLNDIARYCNLSRSMVAQVIRDTEGVKATAQTKAKVLAAVRELDYRPNLAAKSLRTHRSEMIGVLLPSLGSFYGEMVVAIDAALRGRNYSGVFSYWEASLESHGNFLRCYDGMKRQNVDGIITFEYDRILISEKLPIVYYGNERNDLDCVYPDKLDFGRRAVEYLYAMGHRRIGCIGILHEVRYESIYRTMSEFGLAVEPRWQIDSYGLMECGYRDMNRLLDNEELPSALIVHSDLMMLGILRSAKEHGIRIPEDISLLGFDNLKESSYFSPPLTTFDQCFAKAAGLLVETVLKRIEDPERPPEKLPIVMPFVERQSVRRLLQGSA